jgi:hypothetical protein
MDYPSTNLAGLDESDVYARAVAACGPRCERQGASKEALRVQLPELRRIQAYK